MNQKNTRKYTSSDGYLLETAGTLHKLFLQDIAVFTAFDVTMDATFAATWRTKITAVYNIVPHSLIKDILAGKTETVNAIMEDARECYNELRFFSQKAFKNNVAKKKEFGIANYPIARKNQEAMIALLGELHLTSIKYGTQLIAAGYTQAKIDGIEALRQTLDTANLDQENYKTGRPSLTHDRITTLNDCYEITKLVIDAAKLIFRNNPAKRKAYRYKEGSDRRKKKVVEQDEEE